MCIENNSTWRDSETEDQTDISRRYIMQRILINSSLANRKAQDEQKG